MNLSVRVPGKSISQPLWSSGLTRGQIRAVGGAGQVPVPLQRCLLPSYQPRLPGGGTWTGVTDSKTHASRSHTMVTWFCIFNVADVGYPRWEGKSGNGERKSPYWKSQTWVFLVPATPFPSAGLQAAHPTETLSSQGGSPSRHLQAAWLFSFRKVS